MEDGDFVGEDELVEEGEEAWEALGLEGGVATGFDFGAEVQGEGGVGAGVEEEAEVDEEELGGGV